MVIDLNIKKLTKTAIFLLAAIVFQSLVLIPKIESLPYVVIYAVGSLVNLTILLSAMADGKSTAVYIGIITPVLAYFEGNLVSISLIPIVVAGNVVYICFYYYLQKYNKYLALVTSAVAKWMVMFYGGMGILKMLCRNNPGFIESTSVLFNIPQIVTALIGGIAAIGLYECFFKKEGVI